LIDKTYRLKSCGHHKKIAMRLRTHVAQTVPTTQKWPTHQNGENDQNGQQGARFRKPRGMWLENSSAPSRPLFVDFRHGRVYPYFVDNLAFFGHFCGDNFNRGVDNFVVHSLWIRTSCG
jgi:hypothetical protein